MYMYINVATIQSPMHGHIYHTQIEQMHCLLQNTQYDYRKLLAINNKVIYQLVLPLFLCCNHKMPSDSTLHIDLFTCPISAKQDTYKRHNNESNNHIVMVTL